VPLSGPGRQSIPAEKVPEKGRAGTGGQSGRCDWATGSCESLIRSRSHFGACPTFSPRKDRPHLTYSSLARGSSSALINVRSGPESPFALEFPSSSSDLSRFYLSRPDRRLNPLRRGNETCRHSWHHHKLNPRARTWNLRATALPEHRRLSRNPFLPICARSRGTVFGLTLLEGPPFGTKGANARGMRTLDRTQAISLDFSTV
jgi:hypothetical protein